MQQVPEDGKQIAKKMSRSFGAGAAALAVAGTVPTSLSAPFLLTSALMGSLSWKADDLAKDPPRKNWDRSTVARPRRLDFDVVRGRNTLIEQVCEDLSEGDVCLGAAIKAFERAQGAAIARDHEAEKARLAEAAGFADAAGSRIGGVGERLWRVSYVLPRPAGGKKVVRVPRSWDDYPKGTRKALKDAGLRSKDLKVMTHLPRRKLRGYPAQVLVEAVDPAYDFARFLRSWSEELAEYGAAERGG
jgi:hypothetical protein